MAIKSFDAAHSELQTGINLIEASAGTGKTYTIAMLALRFVVEQSLDIKSLLVVTFTKAATEELKNRIRSRLIAARMALNHNQNEIDPGLRQWLDSLQLDSQTIGYRLDMALLDIDQAAIFTIHGFCQRVLAEHALESGQLFDSELKGNIDAIRQNCADDFWRKQLYHRPAWQVALLTIAFPTPDHLLASISRVDLQQTVYPVDSDPDPVLNSLQTLFELAKQSLPSILNTLQTAFQDGLFNDSFIKTVAEKSVVLEAWLADTNAEIADFSWLTSQSILSGLNGRKFLQSKSKPLPSDQQKQNYLHSLTLDCSSFDNLAETLKHLQVVFRRALLQNLSQEMEKVLQQNNVLSFDDLISRLASATSGERGQFLIKELQLRFAAALIDEFQDTDHKQWQIFSRIFSAPDHYLYLIGDPKQAIYKFRGADIYSYFAAEKQANQKYTLVHNWRSHPALVSAVNRLFQRSQPFLLENLAFNPVTAGHSSDDGRIGDQPPLVFWQLDRNSGNLEHWTASKAGLAIRNAVSNEILHLLGNADIVNANQGNQPLQPKDIAILVRSNSQAADYQQALNAVGIPAIINSKKSVFSSPQALEIYSVLQAVAQPGHIPALKQALTINWFNLDGQALYRLSHDDTGLDDWLSRFQDYQLLWQQQGLLSMMQRLLDQEQVEVHLSASPQAERVLTNLHHIIERLQQVSIDEHLAINKTLDWLSNAIQFAQQDNSDDQQLRLESDEDAVNIITLHSSKGLEYPLVFCPSLWQRNDRLKNEQNLIQCHENGEMIVDLGSPLFAERLEKAILEGLAEDLRLCYVALTRAKFRCYICWADVRSKEKANDSALAYLLEFADADFNGQQQLLQALSAEQPQAIQYRLLAPDTQIVGHYQLVKRAGALTYRQRQRSLFTHWQMSSYTALSALSLHEEPELPEDKAVEQADAEASGDGLPKGALTGNVVHSLLESFDFQRLATGADLGEVRNQAIRRYGLRLDSPTRIDKLLQTVVCTPIEPDSSFCLKDLAVNRCLKEMPFYLSMQRMDTVGINNILANSTAYQALSAKQMCGYLTGFIDLICEYHGKYYVMDYKTNSLSNYQNDSLLQAMREHNYGLQYWLYSLVLDRYLQQRLPEYDYHQHFGGVKYLFVRGMLTESPGFGVFADFPDYEKIKALAKLFFGGE